MPLGTSSGSINPFDSPVSTKIGGGSGGGQRSIFASAGQKAAQAGLSQLAKPAPVLGPAYVPRTNAAAMQTARAGLAGFSSPQNVSALLAMQAQQAMQDAQYNARRNALLFEQGNAAAQRDRAIEDLNASTQTALGRLAGDRYRTVDLGTQATYADDKYYDTINSLWDQETQNIAMGQYAQREFLARMFGIETNQLDQLLGFATEDRALNDRGSQLSYDRNRRDAFSDATARGAITSDGFSDTRSELLAQLGIELDNNDLALRRTTAEVGTRRSQAQLAKDKGENALVRESEDRAVATGRTKAQIDRGKEDAARTRASLASIASEFGLRESELQDALRRGTERANIDYASAAEALANAMTGNEEDRLAALAIAQSLAGV